MAVAAAAAMGSIAGARWRFVLCWAILAVAVLGGSYAAPLDSCSREVSRRIRKFLNRDVFSRMAGSPSELPDNCPLNPMFDVYLDQENHKDITSNGEMRCRYCKKLFKNEFYLDRHMDNKHTDKLNIYANHSHTCLADLCPIFGCGQKGPSKNAERWGKPSFSDIKACNALEVEKSRHVCDSMIRRCFRDQYDFQGKRLDEKLKHEICGKLHCQGGKLVGSISHFLDDEDSFFDGTMIKIAAIAIIFMFILFYALVHGLFSRKVRTADRVQQARASVLRAVPTKYQRQSSMFWSKLFGASKKE